MGWGSKQASTRPPIGTKRVHGNARQRYTVNEMRRTATDVFRKANKLNSLGFDSLVDIEGVTGSIPVAPTILRSRATARQAPSLPKHSSKASSHHPWTAPARHRA